MKSQSELLKALVQIARERGISIREKSRSFEFYKNGLLLDRFMKFSTDSTMDEAEYERRTEYLKRF